jgi:hypothetical protein
LTLLEVLLALGIGSLVLATLSAAMHFHLRVVGRRQQEIEEAQLGRALLRKISDDVRGTVLYNPPDMSSLMSLAGAGLPSSGDGGGGGQVSSIVLTSDGKTTTTYAEDAESQSVAPPTSPGLRGGPDWLQVDVSKMPRRDQYDPSLMATTGTGSGDHLSDVKTVTYFVETPLAGADDTSGAGLMRVELARAVTRWAGESGSLDLSGGEPIAPEVTQIAFRYHDGVEANGWVTEWDSDERGALPIAIEIAIHVRSSKPRKTSALRGAAGTAGEEEEGQIFRLVVHLPDRREGDVPENVDTGGEEMLP